MKSNQSNSSNDCAISRRKGLGPINDFTINELIAMPWFFGTVKIQNNDGEMYLGGNDCGTALRLFWNGQYEASSIRIWKALANQARYIFDIGAHTGIYSIVAGNLVKSKNTSGTNVQKIFAFEPYIVNYVRLILNIKLNMLVDIVISNQLGVSERPGSMLLNVPNVISIDYNSAGPTLEGMGDKRRSASSHQVSTIGIDDFYAEKNLTNRALNSFDLFKVDVEGHEPAVLKGMNKRLEDGHAILLLECVNPEPTRIASEMLKSKGYRFLAINEHNNQLINEHELRVIYRTSREGKKELDRRYLNRLCVNSKITDKELMTILNARGVQ